ncbi:MAG: DUF3499 domain-containing protein [Corynebacterium sp.]|nr:DUF3499 domain-containing protein [Corynebacterium sp.]
MSNFRRCSRPGCGKPAVATLTYAYSESTAVVGPLAPASEPHSWDLCEAHAASITAPLGWEMLRVDDIEHDDADDDLTALAKAVREAGRNASGLVLQDFDDSGVQKISRVQRQERQGRQGRAARKTTSTNHPVHRPKTPPIHRKGHLFVVPDTDA